jgi:hypothetical protein
MGPRANPRIMLLLAPVVYFAHILEEAPSFIGWFNSVVTPPMQDGNLVAMNAPSIAITAIFAIVAAWTMRRGAMLILLAWLSYFMLANALFHVIATTVIGRYCPGLITAVLLYLPYFAWLVRYLRRDLHVRIEALAAAFCFGVPMLIQGYMIVFRGSTFF